MKMMMSAMDPQTHDRVYRSLKAEYRAGLLEPGVRLDLQVLADRHRASKTPLREAANRLLGERLFERHPDGGFMVAVLSDEQLGYLTGLNILIMRGIISALVPGILEEIASRALESAHPDAVSGTANAAAQVFLALAEATGNPEAVAILDSINDRLLYPRIAEARGSDRSRVTFAKLLKHWAAGNADFPLDHSWIR
ncbi:GntR family transcriptional regulator [Novosphingobium sp. KA1]|uniref:GntR family transcriptional regulator n=1 Tax=Novosphingobium sp. (strain KA1) TaxID=164608 RepID=UPI001A8FE458|nr:GntR family transcriptional regulator [Novosphingobium sp. KA1]